MELKKRNRTSLLDKARNLARREGMPPQRVQTRLAMEWFLARLQHVATDQFELKGGLALELRLERARSTKDIDLAWREVPDSLDELFRRVCELELEDIEAIEFRIRPNRDHPEVIASWIRGQRFDVSCLIAGSPFGVPFGLDLTWPTSDPDVVEHYRGQLFKDQVGFPSKPIPITALARQVAEKLHAYTLPREHENTRTKDLVDLALLASMPFGAADLRRVIQDTFDYRSSHPIPAEVPAPPEGFWKNYEKIRRDHPNLDWKTIEEVHALVQAFLNPVLGGTAGQWIPEMRAWDS